MRHPPAFQADVVAGQAWCLAWALLVMLASASLLAWCLAMAEGPWAPVALALLPAAWAGRRLRRQSARSLRWDGQVWWLDAAARRGGEAHQGSLRPMLDLGDWMLLRFSERPERRLGQGRRYLALSRADMPQQWPPLRLTLYSAAGLAGSASQPESSPTR